MKYFLVGIGGIGMSAIAKILHDRGQEVVGSDIVDSKITAWMKDLGIKVYMGQKAENVRLEKPDKLIYSSAIKPNTPGFSEIMAAKSLKIPVLKRTEIFRELMKGKKGIAISGMHGKTTTTAMAAHILRKADLDPSALVGGIVLDFDHSNALDGEGDWFIVEACEYDSAFLKFDYDIAAVLNIDEEHMEYFGTIENIIYTFKDFVSRIPKGGYLIAFGDDKNVQKILKAAQSKIITFGYKKENDIQVKDVEIVPGGIEFSIHSKPSSPLKINEQFKIKIPGRHNCLNATTAIIISQIIKSKIDLAQVKSALFEFSGVSRRFEIKKVMDGITVMDDYAHHPTEISATISAVREFYQPKSILAVFRPSQYSRNKELYDEYTRAFNEADKTYILKTYTPAGRDIGEKEKPEVTSKDIIAGINLLGKTKAKYLDDFDEACRTVLEIAKPGDIILVMGLSNMYELANQIADELGDERKR